MYYLINNIVDVIEEGSYYLQRQYEDITNRNSDTMWEMKLLRNHPNTFKCTVLIYYKEKYIHKDVIEIYRKSQKLSGSRDHHLWNEKFCKTVSDIIAPLNTRQIPKMILIEGVSGIGKTTLVLQMASQQKNISFLCQKDFVFLLNFWDPEINNISTESEMTNYFFKDHLPYHKIKEINKYICETNGFCLAIILDGYSENTSNSFFTKLTEGKVLSKCLIIATSRPFDSKNLLSHACRRVEMVGFTEDLRKEYLNAAIPTSTCKHEQIIEHMQNNPTIDRICCVPLNMTFLVSLFNSKSHLPATQTEFFEKFTCLLSGKFDNLSKLESTKHGKILKELAKYSYDLLSKGEMIFYMKDLINKCTKYGSAKESTSCSFGFFKKIQPLFSGGDNNYRFLSLPIQEYLAAYYLSTLSFLDYFKFNAIFDEFLECQYINSNMWVLFFGMIKRKHGFFDRLKFGSKLTKHYAAKHIPHSEMKCLTLFQCYKEADNNEMCTRIRDSLSDNIDFNGHQMLPENMITLCFAITHSLRYSELGTLNLTDCKMGYTGWKYFHQQLKYCLSSFKLTIRALILSNNELAASSDHQLVSQIIHLSLQMEIKTLDLSDNYFCGEAKHFVKMCCHLNFLNLVGNNVNDADELATNVFYNDNKSNYSIAFTKECLVFQQDCISNFMAYSTSVKSLFLDCTKAPFNYQVKQFLLQATSLNVLHLLTQSNFDIRVLDFSKLKEVYVSHLNDKDAKDLRDRFYGSPHDNPIFMVTSESTFYASNVQNAKVVNFALRECRKQQISNIDIFSCVFDIKCLAEALASKTKFSAISIADCDVSDDEIKYLYKRPCTTTVNELYLYRGSLRSFYYVRKLISFWEVKNLYIDNEHLSCKNLKEITSYISHQHLKLEVLTIQKSANFDDELDDICESLFLNPEYSTDLSFIKVKNNNDCSVIIKTLTAKTFRFIKQHECIGSKSLKLYITENNLQSEYSSYDYLRYFKDINDIVVQKLYLHLMSVNVDILQHILKKHRQHIACFYLRADTLQDEDFDNILDNFYYCNASTWIMSKTKVQIRKFILKHHIKFCTQNISSLSLNYCTFNETQLAYLVEALATYRIQTLDLSQCGLSDAGINFIWSLLGHRIEIPSIKTLNLSGNNIRSIAVIKFCSLFETEELWLANNEIQLDDTILITEVLKHKNCHLNYIDLQNNEITNVENTCKWLFHVLDFVFNLIITNQGCIITKSLHFIIQQEMIIESIFFTFKEPLTDQDIQDFEEMVIPLTVLSMLYIMVTVQNENWSIIAESIRFRVVTEELYLCIPNMDDNNLDHFWQYHCKSKLILSKTNFRALNVQDSDILSETLTYITTESNVIALENSTVSYEMMKKLALVISNHGSDKIWQTLKLYNCKISKDHINVFYAQYNQCTKHNKVLIKSVNLSKNRISHSEIEVINRLLEEWNTEELNIAENDLQQIGIQQLIQNDNMCLHILDTQENKDMYTNEEISLLCEYMIFNKEVTIVHLTSNVLVIDGSVFTNLQNYELISKRNVSTIYLKIKLPEQNRLLLNFQDYLKLLDSLEYLFIAVFGSISGNKLIKALKKVTQVKSLILYADSMSANSFKSFTKHYTQNCSMCISTRQYLYIAHCDDETLKQLLNSVNGSLRNATYIIFNNCVMHHNSDSIKHLVKALINENGGDFHLLQMKNCVLAYDHVNEISTTIKDKLKSIILNIEVLDLSYNYLDSQCMEELICIVQDIQIKELILNYNNLQNEDAIAILMKLSFDSNCHLNYIDLQNNNIKSIDKHFSSFLFSCDFSFNIIATNSGCIITRRLSHFKTQDKHLKVNSVYLSIRETLTSDPDLQKFAQILIPTITLKLLYVMILQQTQSSLYHALKTIEYLALLVSEELYLCIPQADSVSESLLKHQCTNSKLILTRNILQAENVKDSEIIFATLDHVHTDLEVVLIYASNLCRKAAKRMAIMMLNVKKLQELKIRECNITDDHIKHLCKVLINNKNTMHSTIAPIKTIDFSNNQISTTGLEIIIKLLEYWKSEKMILAGNSIEYNGLQILLDNIETEEAHSNDQMHEDNNIQSPEVLKNKVLCLNHVDLQNNHLSGVEDLCKEYFFTMDFHFIFIITRNGIILTKDFNGQSSLEDIKSLYLGIAEVLPKLNVENLLQIMKLSAKVKRLYMYFTVLHKGLDNLIKSAKLITVTEQLYICVPYMDDTNADKIWQFQCKSKLILSKYTLLAKNINDKKVFFKTFDYVTADLNIISFEHSYLCEMIVKKLAVIISNNGNSKIWNTLKLYNCNITDHHIICFYEQFIQCKKQCKILIKYVDLSNNKISSSVTKEIIHLLKHWESDNLIIAENNLQYSGLVQLVTAQDMSIVTLDTRQNNVESCSIEDITHMCEEMTFNHSFNFTFAHVTNNILVIDASLFSSHCNPEVMCKSDILNVYIKGAINSLHIDGQSFISNMQTFVSSFSNLENLFIALQGDATFEDDFVKLLQNVNLAKKFILYAEHMSKSNYISFKEPSNITGILLQQNIYIVNSDDKVLNNMLNNMTKHCEDLTSISINNCIMNSYSFELLAKGLIFTSVNVSDISIEGCKVEDSHMKHFHETLQNYQQLKAEFVTVKIFKLPNNCLKSLCVVIELVCILQIKELHLNNNQIQGSDTRYILDAIGSKKCHLKFISLQNNHICNVEDLCKKCYLDFEFSFMFIITKNGITIMKDLVFNVKLTEQNTESLYLMIKDVLIGESLQNIFKIMNDLPKKLNRLYIIILTNQYKRFIPDAKSLIITKDLYLCVPYMDTECANEFWQHPCVNKLVLSKYVLKGTHLNDNKMLFKTFNYINTNLQIISLENCIFCDTMIKMLAKIISHDGNDKAWSTVKLYNCHITDGNVKCFYEQFIQCEKQGIIQVGSVDLSHSKLSSIGIRMIMKLLAQSKSKELIITDNNLEFDGLQTLVNTVVDDINFVYLQRIDARLNNVQCSREQITQLCELIVFNNNCNIKYARIENFLIMDGNDLYDNSDITDISSVCFTGNISASKQTTFLTSFIRFLLSFKKCTLENLYILMSGELVLDEKFFDILKKIVVDNKLVINVKSIPKIHYMYNFIKQLKENFVLSILSEQYLYISNNNKVLFLFMLNNMNKYYKKVSWMFINRCAMNDSQMLDLLSKAMTNKGKEVEYLALTQCEIGGKEIILMQKSLALSCKQYDHTDFAIKSIDLSSNCLESECGKALIKLTGMFKTEEIILINNKILVDDVEIFMAYLNDKNCLLKLIDCQNNGLENLDGLCERYFLQYKFDMGFFLVKGGIVLTKSLPFSQLKRDISDINALFVRKTTTFTRKDFHALMSYTNLGKQLNNLYMALHKNQSLPIIVNDINPEQIGSDRYTHLHLTEKDLKILLPSRSLYVYAPKVIKADLWWLHDCKSKFVLSKQSLQAFNITDIIVLHDILDTCLLIKTLTIIKFINCSLHSDSLLLTKLAQILCNGDDSKTFQNLELCNCCINDSDIKCFYDSFTEHNNNKLVIVNRVDLSDNEITFFGVQMIINLLKSWKSEELVVIRNFLNSNGLHNLINATKRELGNLKILDAQENNLRYSEGDDLSKALFLDSASSISYFRTKSKNNFTLKGYDNVVIKQTNVNAFAIHINTDKNTEFNANFTYCLLTNSINNNVTVNLLHCLKLLTSLTKFCLLGQVLQQEILADIVKQNNSIEELHFYIHNMTNAIQIQIMQTLTKTCQSVTILSAKSFKAIKSSCSYIKKGIYLVLQLNHNSFESLNDISFTYCKLDNEALHLLHEMVWDYKQNKVWECIDLSHCALEDQLGVFLKPSSIMQHEIVVKNINLSFNKLNSAVVDLITNIVMCWKIKHLYMNDNNLKDDGVEKFSEFLITNGQLMDTFSLKILKMENNCVTYPTAETLARVIQKTFHNKQFWLCMDHVLLVQETKAVPEGVMVDHSFKSLYGFNCNIQVIFNFKHCFRNIENVGICNDQQLSQSQVNSEDLIEEFSRINSGVSIVVALQETLIAKNTNAYMLHHMLKEVEFLSIICFKNSKITSETLHQVVRLLSINITLSRLSFDSCNLGKDGCEILLKLLTPVKPTVSIVSLSLSSNLIESHEDVQFIAEICRHLKVSELYLNNNKLQDSRIKYFAKLLKEMEHAMKAIDFRNNHTCNITEGEFIHISNCKLQVFITRETKLFYEDHHQDSTDSDDRKIMYLYFIKYVFTNEFEKMLPYSFLNKFHLVGELNMNSREFTRIIQTMQTDELLLVIKNFTPSQALDLFDSASCSIVVAIEGTILGKNCKSSALINTALEYANFSHVSKVCFIKCVFTNIENTIERLLQFYECCWEQLIIEHCKINDNACTSLAYVLSTTEKIIKSVSFSSNLLTSSSTKAIVNIIKILKISQLCLNDNNFTAEDVICILSTIIKTYNLQEISFEQNKIDELQINCMIKGKFLSFEFDNIYDICDKYYNCHTLLYVNPKRWYFYRFFIDSDKSNMSKVCNPQLKVEKMFINARPLNTLQLLENDLYFLSGTISEIYTIMNCRLSDFNEQQLNKQASMNIKLILSNETVTSLESLQTQAYMQLPCLTILVSSQVDNTEGISSKLVSSMPEISFIHIVVMKMINVNNVIDNILKDLLNITSIKMLEIHIKEGVNKHSKIISKIISGNKELEALNLSNNNLESSEITDIASGIKCISSLQSVNLSNNSITVQDRETLLFILTKGIRQIYLSNNPLYLEIHEFTTLTTLDLSFTCLGIVENNIKNLIKMMENNVNLEILNLSGNGITDEIDLIVTPLKTKMLKCLNISHNEITYRGARFISNIILQSPLLQELDVSNNPLSSKDINRCGIIIILQALQTIELPHIKSLDFGYTGNANTATTDNLTKTFNKLTTLEKINISGIEGNISTILKSFENLSSVKALILKNCSIGYKDANILSNLISKKLNLQVLNINNNNITASGFKAILNAFLAHPISHLKMLQVAKNKIELDKLTIDVDKTNNKKLYLDHFDISNNKCKETAILCLLTNFIDAHSLKMLNINCHEVKGQTNSRILNYLAESAKKLEYLNISWCRFTSDKLQSFLEHIHLTHINISCCGITKDIANEIVKNRVFNFSTLNNLDLSDNGPALPILCSSIKNIHTLKLQRCDISIDLLDALLCYDSAVCVLHLCHNNLANKKQARLQFTDRLAQKLANPLNNSLKELCLQNCDLSTTEALAIITALKNNNVLKWLNLNNNCMLYKTFCSQLTQVENALRENSCLEQICIVGKAMKARETASLMLSCAEYSSKISRIELPLTISEKDKADISKRVKRINTLRVKHRQFIPLSLVFLHKSNFDH